MLNNISKNRSENASDSASESKTENRPKTRSLTRKKINEYCQWLRQNEKSRGTITKYGYYLEHLRLFLNGREISKELLLQWKQELRWKLSPSTVNCALAALNGFLRYEEWDHLTVRFVKVARRIFCQEQRDLSKQEYCRLIETAEAQGKERMALLMQTVCSTGIRISELPYITVEAASRQFAEVDCKGKIRRVLLTGELCRRLKAYARRKNITSGTIFVTRTGKPLDRSNIWREMKKLSQESGVAKEKIFPHNLRHLFAKVYYSMERDLLRLSDILGHSNINTTRIYTMESGGTHIRQLEKMDLLTGKYNKMSLLLYSLC